MSFRYSSKVVPIKYLSHIHLKASESLDDVIKKEVKEAEELEYSIHTLEEKKIPKELITRLSKIFIIFCLKN